MVENLQNEQKKLTDPHVRIEMIDYLREITDSELSLDADDLKFIVNFFFDDHNFDIEEEVVGAVLFNSSEFKFLTDFISTFDLAIGSDKHLKRIDNDNWKCLRERATRLYRLLSIQVQS